MVAVSAVLTILALVLLRHFVAEPYRVPSDSMAPSLQSGDLILVDLGSRGAAQRGQLVVFDGAGYFSPADGTDHFWVKRVIGVAGDTVEFNRAKDPDHLLVNGQPLAEPYLPDGVAASAVEFTATVPEGRIFVMGDNRIASSDSRDHLGSPGGGMIPVERVRGEVTIIVLPLGRSGAVRAIE